jgi:hypothetical protein
MFAELDVCEYVTSSSTQSAVSHESVASLWILPQWPRYSSV